jgi:hypothetical protein
MAGFANSKYRPTSLEPASGILAEGSESGCEAPLFNRRFPILSFCQIFQEFQFE